jgi:hypothetical protein
MPILDKFAQAAARQLPKVIPPKAHAVIDYINAGVLLMGATVFWRRNKRAAVGALVSAGAVVALNLLTEYPGGVRNAIPFRKHRDIDLGLATLTALMPEILAFQHEQERRLFRVEGALMSAATELTCFPRRRRRAEPGQVA